MWHERQKVIFGVVVDQVRRLAFPEAWRYGGAWRREEGGCVLRKVLERWQREEINVAAAGGLAFSVTQSTESSAAPGFFLFSASRPVWRRFASRNFKARICWELLSHLSEWPLKKKQLFVTSLDLVCLWKIEWWPLTSPTRGVFRNSVLLEQD